MIRGWVPDRRRFIGAAAMTLAAARCGALDIGAAEGKAPRLLEALARAGAWLNTAPVTAESLAGKVVLVQFGTYTCINWLRTLPYVRAWTQRYRSALAVIVVHTPEFEFEKDVENVRRAMQQMKIGFPLAVDNDYTIWRAFDNHYWPAAYLIDARGRLRTQQFGEGEYDRLERSIRQLLMEAGAQITDHQAGPAPAAGAELAADWGDLRSPELYLGSARTQNFSSPEGARSNRRRLYTVPTALKLNRWALEGEWTMADQPTRLETAPGRVVCRFHARDVHLVMGPRLPNRPVRFHVSLDGQPPGAAHGSDADASGTGTASDQRMYQLIRQPLPIVERTFEIRFEDPGVEVFAFTFG
jgi:hypothetical protein